MHHPATNTDEAAIGEEIMNWHVAHLGDHPLRSIGAERVDSFEVLNVRPDTSLAPFDWALRSFAQESIQGTERRLDGLSHAKCCGK